MSTKTRDKRPPSKFKRKRLVSRDGRAVMLCIALHCTALHSALLWCVFKTSPSGRNKTCRCEEMALGHVMQVCY